MTTLVDAFEHPMANDLGFDERRDKDKPTPQKLLGLYQRIWRSRDKVVLVLRELESENDLDSKAISLTQLIRYLRNQGYITPLNNNGIRFMRTDREMPRANSHRDLKSFLKNQRSETRKEKRAQRRRTTRKIKRQIY